MPRKPAPMAPARNPRHPVGMPIATRVIRQLPVLPGDRGAKKAKGKTKR